MLDRLLLLNHQRHEEEVRVGLFEKGAKAKKTRGAKTPTALSQNGGKGYNSATIQTGK